MERSLSRKYARVGSVVLTLFAVLLLACFAFAAEPTNADTAEEPVAEVALVSARSFAGVLCIQEGASLELPLPDVKRFVVGAPNLVGAEKTEGGLNLTGRRAGTTLVSVWDGSGSNTYQVRVANGEIGTGGAGPELDPTAGPVDIILQPGQSELLRRDRITRIAVGDPAIADAVMVTDGEVLLNAKKEGVTTVRLWEAQGLATYNVTVVKPGLTVDEAAAAISGAIGCPTIIVDDKSEAVILSGAAPSAEVMLKAVSVAEATGKKVVNLITVDSVSPESVIAALKAAVQNVPLTYEVLPDGVVMVRGAVPTPQEARTIKDIIQAWLAPAEAAKAEQQPAGAAGSQEEPAEYTSNSRAQAHEVDSGDVTVKEEFTFTRCVFSGRVPNGPKVVGVIEVNPAVGKQILVSAQVLEIDRGRMKELGIDWAQFVAGVAQPLTSVFEPATVPAGDAGPWNRTGLVANLKALIDEKAARILSEPRVLIADGWTANILVGGEFPIPIAQTSAVGGGTITIQFKTYGIQLAVRPKTVPDGRILLTLTPEVSRLDFNQAIRTANILIPSITTRRATTTVHVSNGQSLAIGGLLSSEDAKQVTRIPLLSKIPIIGELFKSTRFVRNQTELILLVTPTIVENGSEVPIPPVGG